MMSQCVCSICSQLFLGRRSLLLWTSRVKDLPDFCRKEARQTSMDLLQNRPGKTSILRNFFVDTYERAIEYNTGTKSAKSEIISR